MFLIKDVKTETPQGQLVTEHIIPAISKLRQDYRISYTTMFRGSMIMGKPVVPTMEIGDLNISDMVFDIPMNKYVSYLEIFGSR